MSFTVGIFLHRIDPYAIHLWGDFGIRWYGLAYIAGFIAAYLIILWLTGRMQTPLNKKGVGDFILTVAIGTIVGGRLGYCAFYNPSMFVEFTSDFPWWGVLSINQGGMASHGGIIGVILACLYYAHKHKISALHLLDLTTLGGTIGIFFGRIANFINGELLGRACDQTLLWAVKFPQEIIDWLNPTHPKHGLLTDPEYLKIVDHVNNLEQTGLINGEYTQQQIITAAQNDVDTSIMLEPLLTPRHPSQIYQGLLEGVLLFAILFFVWRKPRKPGVIGGLFLSGYAVMRIFGEQFRLPDAHIGYQWLNLTRGQWISIVMLGIGCCLLWYWSRRDVEKIGGWE